MSISVEKIDLNVLNMHTRFPFKYGIASLVALPHLFVRARVKVDGKTEIGLAAEGLPPKWFTKNPDAPFDSDLDEMLTVIQNACDIALHSDAENSVFDLWQTIYAKQSAWATTTAYPPLLWSFGVSMIERAVIDAFCQSKRRDICTNCKRKCIGHSPVRHPQRIARQRTPETSCHTRRGDQSPCGTPWASPIH